MMIDAPMVDLASQRLTEAGFVLALAACLFRRNWGYAFFLALALAEAYANKRYEFHGHVRDWLLAHVAGASKPALQSTLIYVAGMLGLAVTVLLVPHFVKASSGRRLMTLGALACLAVLALELTSLHKIDAVIYHPAGPFTRCAIAYFVGAVAIALGALTAPRRR